MNNGDQWKELGIDAEFFYQEPPFEGQDVLIAPMMMSSLLIDPWSRHGNLICAQMRKFPKALIDPSQDIIKEIIDRHLLFSDIPLHPKGQMWAVELYQRIKVQLRNMVFRSRNDICTWLRNLIGACSCGGFYPNHGELERKSMGPTIQRRGVRSCHLVLRNPARTQ